MPRTWRRPCLATTLGIQFDAEKDYNARNEQYFMGGEIVDTTSITMAVTAEPAACGQP